MTVHFFHAGHINNLNRVAQVTNERTDCNKLGTYHKFKQYEQQEMINSSILVWDTASQTTK